MKFSHGKNRKGHIFDGVFRHRAQPGASLPFDDIAALSPILMAQLQYAVYGGSQVLFQDTSCTTPVTASGDPIGGVRSIIDGSIVATQSTDAERPIWQGETVGTRFDGTDQWLELASAAQRNPSQATTWVYREFHPAAINHSPGAWSAAVNTDVAYAWYYRTDEDLIQRVGVGTTSLAVDAIPVAQWNTFSVRNDTTDYTARVNGSDVQTRSTGADTGDPAIPAALGSVGGTAQYFAGDMRFFALFSSALSTADLEVIEGVA